MINWYFAKRRFSCTLRNAASRESRPSRKRELRGVYQSHFLARFICKSHFPPLKFHSHSGIQKKSQCYIHQLFRSTSPKSQNKDEDRKIWEHFQKCSERRYDPFTLWKNLQVASIAISAWSSYYITFLSFLPAGNLPSHLLLGSVTLPNLVADGSCSSLFQ